MPHQLDVDRFRVPPGKRFRLRDWPTSIKPLYRSRHEYETLLADHKSRMLKLQEKLYADNRYALLIIFQAMDAAGKDSAIEHVMSGVNPQGCQVHSFRHPSEEELEHDFLWRTTLALPARGHIGIFNRSYYEEVLIVRVHKEILAAERLPENPARRDDFWKERYRSINDLERHLTRNGTRIIKFFLNLSREEQRKRLLARIDDPEKNWKFNFADLRERDCWDDYMKAYELCLEATSTRHAPWYAVPADDKKNARLLICAVVVEALGALPIDYPKLGSEQLKRLKAVRAQLDGKAHKH